MWRILLILMLLASSTYQLVYTSSPHVFDGKYAAQNTVRVLIEAINNYNGNNAPLYYAVDAADKFGDKIASASSSIFTERWYNSIAWPRDWWTQDFGGSDLVSLYNYALFDGHGGIASIYFSISQQDRWGTYRSYADFTYHKTVNNQLYIMVHPTDSIRWIALAACNFLYLDQTDEQMLIRYGFNGGYDPVDLRDAYLHGIVGMHSEYIDSYVDAFGNRHNLNTPTLSEFADKLISGKSFKEAWFDAIHDNQKYGCFLWWCAFQGSPAVIYPRILFCYYGYCTVYYTPENEGMEPFGNVVQSPKAAFDAIPPGIAFVVEWDYEVG